MLAGIGLVTHGYLVRFSGRRSPSRGCRSCTRMQLPCPMGLGITVIKAFLVNPVSLRPLERSPRLVTYLNFTVPLQVNWHHLIVSIPPLFAGIHPTTRPFFSKGSARVLASLESSASARRMVRSEVMCYVCTRLRQLSRTPHNTHVSLCCHLRWNRAFWV